MSDTPISKIDLTLSKEEQAAAEKNAGKQMTAEEKKAQRDAVNAAKAAKKAEAAAKMADDSDKMAQMFGFSGSSDEANHKFAATLMKYDGWKNVTYRGKGTFDVDYRYSGKLTHDFVFPIFPKMDMIFPFIMVRKRADGAVTVTAPALIGGGLKALAHAVIPGLCITSGSDTVKRLNTIMVEQRRLKGQDVTQMLTVDWVI